MLVINHVYIYIFVLIHSFLTQTLAGLFPKFLQRKMLSAEKVNKCTTTLTCLICYCLVLEDVSKWNIELLMLQWLLTTVFKSYFLCRYSGYFKYCLWRTQSSHVVSHQSPMVCYWPALKVSNDVLNGLKSSQEENKVKLIQVIQSWWLLSHHDHLLPGRQSSLLLREGSLIT